VTSREAAWTLPFGYEELDQYVTGSATLPDLLDVLGPYVMEHADEVVERLSSADLRVLYDNVVDGLHEWLDRVGSRGDMPLPEDVWSALLDTGEELAPPTMAKAMVTGIAERARPALLAALGARGTVELVRGSWAPFPASPLRELTDIALAPRPTVQDRRYSPAFAGGGLLHDPPVELKVVYDFSQRAALGDALSDVAVLATVHPSPAEQEYSIDAATDTTFFGYRPTDDVPVLDAARSLLQKAFESGVAVAVLPELWIGPDVDIQEWLSESVLTYPRVVVAGSRHVRDEGEQHNECSVYLDGVPVHTHHKTHAFLARTSLPGDGNGWRGTEQDPALPVERVEDLHPSRTVTVLFADRWAFSVAVCADLNWSAVSHALADHRVNLVCVPAMSPKPGYFHTALSDIAQRSRGIGVLANDRRHAPAGASVPSAMFALCAERPVVMEHVATAPALVLWRLPDVAEEVNA